MKELINRAVGTVAAATMLASHPSAQSIQPSPVELGATVGVVSLNNLESSGTLFGFGPRLTANLGRQTAAEAIVDVMPRGSFSFRDVYGLYHVQIKRGFRAPDASRTNIFWTAGGGGSFYRKSFPEFRRLRPGGSLIVIPERTQADVSRPVFISGGAGFERLLSSHAAFRLEGQALFVPEAFGRGVIVRVMGGISIPIGRFRY